MIVRAGQSLPRAPGDMAWSHGTTASVIFVPHLGTCPACVDYARRLGDAAHGLREWATKALIVTSAEAEAEDLSRCDVRVLADEGQVCRAALGVGDEEAAVIQADRWAAVYEVAVIDAGQDAHAELPDPRDLVALAQYIDIQCPECEVPSKEWLAVSPFPLG